jgi:ubiquinol-cytochrome c reductase iron-sulfur subunit
MSDQQHSGPSGARTGADAGTGTASSTGDRIQADGVTGSGDVQASGTSHDALVGDEGSGAPGAGAEGGRLVERPGRDGELTRTWSNPGLPAHVYRRSDVDPKAAQRREREVATFFGVSTLGTLLFIVAYFAIKPGGEDILEEVSLSTKLLGLGLGLALFCIGAGAIHWAKTLMPDDEIVQDRKPMRSSEEDRAAAVEAMKEGAAGAGLGRRKLIRNSLLGAMAPLGLLAIIPLRDLGPLPAASLTGTWWKAGRRVVTDPTGRPIKAAEIPIGTVIHVQPEGVENAPHPINERAKSATLVIRLEPDEIQDQKQLDWSVDGIVAYSKICTHVGCPVGLYEQQTHHLLCPCHQSTYDVTRDCAVIFGPAARPLPQLPLDVDEEGYLVARSDYQEPVGPSFWERG